MFNMTQHNDTIRLRHMLDNAREAVKLIAGKDKSVLLSDRVLELALIRLVEVVGEASAKVSSAAQAKYSTIPWSQVIGMRNRLIHGYDSVDLDILWDTIEVDLPPLIAELENILGEAGEE
jgi:uncharacterized protein with HEPN domain